MAAIIIDSQENALGEIKLVAKVFQNLETILSYGILLFKNEDEVLNPILDEVDECTRILDKFNALHPLYQIILGKNYLSSLKVVLKKVLQLIKNSKLKINSPKEFLGEMRQRYPDLIYLLCKDLLDEKLKKKLQFLPDSLENAINDQLDSVLSKFKNKFKV